MARNEFRPAVPEDWFVDPVRLGIPGIRSARPDEDDDNPLSWQTDALCAQTDPEAFFPEKGGSTRDAKKICTTCEVKAQCLEYALAERRAVRHLGRALRARAPSPAPRAQRLRPRSWASEPGRVSCGACRAPRL